MKVQRRHLGGVAAIGVTFGTLLLGCGSSTKETAPTTATRPVPAKVEFWSPVVKDWTIPGRDRCSPRVWLPLRWGKLPSGTAEVLIYITGYSRPVDAPDGTVNQAVISRMGYGGLNPEAHGIEVGPVPGGATAMEGGQGALCPPTLEKRDFELRLYALPGDHRVPRTTLEHVTPRRIQPLAEGNASGIGEFVAHYN